MRIEPIDGALLPSRGHDLPPMIQLSQFLYLSRIKGDRPFEVVQRVMREARSRNAQHGVTGLLVFDGARVLQYLEADAVTMRWLVNTISADPRHEALKVLHQGPLEGERRFVQWTMGYLLLDAGRGLADFEIRTGLDAVRGLLDIVLHLDSDP